MGKSERSGLVKRLHLMKVGLDIGGLESRGEQGGFNGKGTMETRTSEPTRVEGKRLTEGCGSAVNPTPLE